jgi:mRNA interferase RelE/StbE
MASWKIHWRNSTKKDLRRIAVKEIPRIIEAVESLSRNPYPVGCVKLSGSESAFRIRVGDYRIIYEIIENQLMIEVIKVGHRRDVYQ